MIGNNVEVRLPAPDRGRVNAAIEDVAKERQRQIEAEGFTYEHDDEHDDGAMAWAAACYAAPSLIYRKQEHAAGVNFCDPWPWDIDLDKRIYDGNAVLSNAKLVGWARRDLLVKAAALIVAEIDRLDRGQRKEKTE